MKFLIESLSSLRRSHVSAQVAFFFILFFTAASMMPVRIAAQQGPAKSVVAKTAKTEQTGGEENDIYRHSSTVQKLAKVFNVDVETAAKGFECFNFAIIILAIGIPLGRMLPKILRTRREVLSRSIDDARAATTDAKTRLSAVEAKLANLDVEIAAFRAQIETESAGDEARIKSTIAEERERIVSAAGQEIAQAAAQAQRGLRQFAAELAIDRAVNELALSDEADRALIAQFAGDVAGSANGRKN